MRYKHNPITRLVAILHRRTHMYFARELKPYGLSFTHFRMLTFLSRNEDMKQEDIRAFIDMDKGAVAHAIKRLVEAGYVAREPHPDYRRAYVIRLTQSGLDFLEGFTSTADKWSDQVVKGLSTEEKRLAEGLLQRMVDNTCELLEDDCKEPGECSKKHN